MLDLFLEGGILKEKNYRGSLGVLRDIVAVDPQARTGMHLRLAIATSLAHAKPGGAFGSGEIIDPVKRYQHFKNAQHNNELVPLFDDLSVWEYAKVVDSTASDQDLTWARKMLQTIRPDLVREARFIAMVSEVQYTTAKYGPSPTFATVLNGGGKCGPRAWFGRMINQAFGVPVWGVKQPGHAAVGFLGNEGWKVKLGRGWDHSTWDGMNGNQFLAIVKDRSYAENVSKTEHLRWFADALAVKDQAEAVRACASRMQKSPQGPQTVHKLTTRKYPAPQPEPPVQSEPEINHIVATSFTKSHEAFKVPSFEVGNQVYFQKNNESWVEYPVAITKEQTYGITLGHAVANGSCRVRIYSGDVKGGYIVLNNTGGLWGKTKEIDFVLPKTDTLRFVFPPQRGVVLKWIDLKAKGSAPPTSLEAEPVFTPKIDKTDPRSPTDAG